MSTDSPSSNAVDRALNILELVAERSDGFTNSEISHRLGIPKSSASYILRTLERRGYLRRDRRSGRYTIGIKIVGLAKEGLELADLRQAASPVLVQLAAAIVGSQCNWSSSALSSVRLLPPAGGARWPHS